MMLFVTPLARFVTRTVVVVALTVACLGSGIAQAQELTAQQPSAAENDSAAEASKQAANPLASVWLMQFQQNSNWIGMPANGGNRVQSNLQFQPLMSVKLTDDWSLVTRPVLQLFNTTPFQDQTGQANRMTGFGDTAVALALSPGHRLVGNWLLAAGPTFIVPTATGSYSSLRSATLRDQTLCALRKLVLSAYVMDLVIRWTLPRRRPKEH
jgi:hypothetical protein